MLTLKKTPFSVAIPALEKAQGYIVAITSLGAQLRVPGGSDGCISKHAVNRLVEFIALGKIPFFFFLVFEKPIIKRLLLLFF